MFVKQQLYLLSYSLTLQTGLLRVYARRTQSPLSTSAILQKSGLSAGSGFPAPRKLTLLFLFLLFLFFLLPPLFLLILIPSSLFPPPHIQEYSSVSSLSLEVFVHVVLKFLELFDHFYDYSFKSYDLRFLQVIPTGAHFYGTGRFGSPYCLGLSQCLCFLQWNVGMWPYFFFYLSVRWQILSCLCWVKVWFYLCCCSNLVDFRKSGHKELVEQYFNYSGLIYDWRDEVTGFQFNGNQDSYVWEREASEKWQHLWHS